jgi:deoxyadenosine/deoxycytidine kinase
MSLSHHNTGVVTIEGLIGAGKSTLKAWLETECSLRNLHVVFVDEPVQTWQSIQDTDGTSILSRFYENPAAWAFSFQMMAYISRLHLLSEARRDNPHALIIAERSLSADRHVFAQMLHDSGDISTIDFAIYLKWFDYFAADFRPDMIIYVDTPCDLAIQRIARRSREGESAIDADYIARLKTYTDAWIAREQDIVTMVSSIASQTDGTPIEIPVADLGRVLMPDIVLRASRYAGASIATARAQDIPNCRNCNNFTSAWALDVATGSNTN